MKKKIVSVIAAAALAATLAMPAFAEWKPSVAQSGGVTVSAATAKKADGQEVKLEVTNDVKTDSTGKAEDVKTSKAAYVKVTSVAQTMAATKDATGNADETMDNGLTYAINESTNLVYSAATKSDSTSVFLNKMNAQLRSAVEAKVQEKIEAKKAALTEQQAALEAEVQQLKDAGKEEEAAAKQAEADAVSAELAQVENADYASVDNYSPIAVFDVTPTAGALEELGDDGKIAVEMEIPGVTEDGDYIGIHFKGELENAAAVQEELESNFDAAIANYDAEVLDVVAGDGKVTIELSTFSPVMILSRVETATPAAAVTVPAENAAANDAVTSEVAAETPAETKSGNGWVLPAVIVVAVIAIGGVFAATRGKNKKTAAKK